MANLAEWSLLAFAALQVYAALALLPGKEHRAARWFLAVLFLANALFTGADLAVRLAGVAHTLEMRLLDDATNALLVLAAEAAALAVLGATPSRGRWVAVGLFAVLVAAVPGGGKLMGVEAPATFTLLAYAYASARLFHAWWRAPPGPGTGWAPWLALAFVPRAAEFGVGYAHAIGDPWAWLTPVHVAAAAGLLSVGVATLALAARRPGPLSGALLGAVGAGLVLGVTRYPGLALPNLVQEPVVVYFTLGAVRPLAIIGGLASAGLLGGTLRKAAVQRHAVVVTGVVLAFALAVATIPALLANPSSPLALLVAAAAALASAPLWSWLAERTASKPPLPSVGPRSAAGVPAQPLTSPAVSSRPGLDPVCRFGPDHLAWYARSRDAFESLAAVQRDSMRALTRTQRLLLALRGSSPGTLGDFRFSQAGVQLATHIPYRHIAGAVQKANAPVRLVETSTGVRGVRHYWLNERGREQAEGIASSLGLAEDARPLLGEAFHRGSRVSEAEPQEGSPAESNAA